MIEMDGLKRMIHCFIVYISILLQIDHTCAHTSISEFRCLNDTYGKIERAQKRANDIFIPVFIISI